MGAEPGDHRSSPSSGRRGSARRPSPSRSPTACARRGEDPVAISADALQVYRGLELLTAAPTAAERERLEHRLVGRLPVTETLLGRRVHAARPRRDRRRARGRAPADRRRGDGPLPARCADRTGPETARRRRACALASRPRTRLEGTAALHAELEAAAPRAAAAIDPADRSRVIRALELLESGPHPRPGPATALPALDGDHPASHAARRPDRRPGGAVRADRRASRRDGRRRGRSTRCAAPTRPGRRVTARAALGFDELLAGDVEALKRRTRNLAKRQLTWMRKLGGAPHRQRHLTRARGGGGRVGASL